VAFIQIGTLLNLNTKAKKFENSEQAFMWEKANFFSDKKIANMVLDTPDPSDNKKIR